MPLRWARGRNPYVHTYFGRLGLGVAATPRQIVGREADLRRLLNNNKPPVLAGVALDEHALSEAKNMLLDRERRAQEQVLVHAQPPRTQSKLKDALKRVEESVAPPPRAGALPLRHPLALLWFLPATPPVRLDLPAMEELGLCQAGAPEDLDLDIVFDS